MSSATVYNNNNGHRSVFRHSPTAEIDEEAVVPFEPYILYEGVLEKFKARKEFFLVRPFGKTRVSCCFQLISYYQYIYV